MVFACTARRWIDMKTGWKVFSKFSFNSWSKALTPPGWVVSIPAGTGCEAIACTHGIIMENTKSIHRPGAEWLGCSQPNRFVWTPVSPRLRPGVPLPRSFSYLLIQNMTSDMKVGAPEASVVKLSQSAWNMKSVKRSWTFFDHWLGLRLRHWQFPSCGGNVHFCITI